uniref:Protein FAM32A n=2 Tax=Sus scrofa TaxID=9823 RepID=A0A8D1QSU9_PIG
MEAHEHVQQGPPKLKGGPELRAIRRKKKKKAKDKAKLPEGMGTIRRDKEEKPPGLDVGTPAQVAFEKMQEERQGERIPKKWGFQPHEWAGSLSGDLSSLFAFVFCFFFAF